MQRHRDLGICLAIVLVPVLLVLYQATAQAVHLEPQSASFDVSRHALHFMGVEGGTNPRVQWLGITNTGSEPIHWDVSVDGGASWLDVRPASGLDDGAVRVGVETAGLISGTFTETLTVSAHETTAVEVIHVTLVVTSTASSMYAEDFEAYAAGTEPDDWLDTDADNSLVENDSLFQVLDLGGEIAFGTVSTSNDIHSHYVGVGSDAFSAYEYTGRMRMTATSGGIGVTFFSQYPQTDAYYRLRRLGDGAFHLSPRGTTLTGGVSDTGVVPEPDVWYLFRVQIEDVGTRTEIKARVWAEGTAEPAGWQVDCYDAGPARLAAGTVGVWGYGEGSKYWDDVVVNPLPPEPDGSSPFVYGHAPAPGATYVDPSSNVVVHVADQGLGVDNTALTMTVGGGYVSPAVAGTPADYVLTYDPPVDFEEGRVVTVTVDACDLALPANCMTTEVYTFTTWTLPVIDVWHGAHQVFGHIGNPQRWVNVLGDVSDPDGMVSLTYSVNGGPASPLSIGPDGRRLASEGDFNIEIDYTELISGSNQVVITATDRLNYQRVGTVTVEYVSGNVWPRPYSIDWDSVADVADAAQIVDGLWVLEAGSIRPAVLGYDRIVAIGDMTWDDYEVTVPITIHRAEPVYEYPSNGAGVGILMRWNGHVAWGDAQPRYGWYPMGAMGWYTWQADGGNRLSLSGNQGALIAEDTSRRLNLDVPYNFKMHVETIPGAGGLYGFKVWQASEPEPLKWDFVGQEGLDDPQYGSLLLMAHHVDASFGDVTVTPGPFDDIIPPLISNIRVVRQGTSATITWTTNEPATSSVAYGPSTAYENGTVTDQALVTSHAINLTGLFAEMLYHYRVTSVDGSGNVSSSKDLTFMTTATLSNIASDDFNTCGLDTGLWTFIDPYPDDPLKKATLAVTGTHTPDARLTISVPAGTAHDVWGAQRAPRIMQPANNAGFEIEVKFESGLSEQYQIQGVLVEQDSDDLLRFDFHSDGSSTLVFAAIIASGTPSTTISRVIASAGVAPLYMRVGREGDQWTQSYSYDGEAWAIGGRFAYSLTVSSVGAFVGNSGSSPPAHSGSLDYFFNTASPVVAEDGDRNAIAVHVVGSGTVVKEPDRLPYACGQVVTLTAMADPGWRFGGWSGGLMGSTNPTTVTMTGDRVITATFTNSRPVLDPIDDQAVVSGNVLSFTVSASDPDGITPTLGAENLPGGADFTDNGNGTALFDWQTTLADEGSHVVTFIASDGVLTDSQTITITVNARYPYHVFLPSVVRNQQVSPAAYQHP